MLASRPRTGPLVVVALFLSGALAGCLGAGPVETAALTTLPPLPRFEVLPGEAVWIEASSDGTELHANLFRPDTAAEPAWKAPTILVMSPYFGDDAREDPDDITSRPTYFRYQWLIDEFVPRGYAVAFADVRGTGDSGGCLEQTAELQWQDAYDTVETFGTAEWSNGKVGMFGKSYDAETQLSAAVMAPPHLATIVPVSSVSGQYEYSFYDGVPFTGLPFTPQAFASNAFYAQSDGLQVPRSEKGLMQYPTRVGCHPGMLAQGLDTTGDWNAFWEAREIRKHAEKVEASVLYVHGLQDWNVKPVAIRDWFDRIPSTKRAVLGQWAHDYPEQNRFVEEWSRQDWRETVVQWYDHFLLGVENGILDALPPVQVQDSAGVWRREATYPPTDTVPLALHLSADGLVAAPPAGGEPMRLRENGEAYVRNNAGVPLADQDSAPYAAVLAFDSAPFDADVRWSGWPTLAFEATLVPGLTPLPSKDAHFAAVLYDVAPDGEATWINRGYLSARHRDGVESPSDVPEGEAVQYVLRFHPSDTVVPAGHGLRLTLAGSDEWTMPENNGWAADIAAGTLTLPVVVRDMAAVALDVPMGAPIEE